MRPLTSEERPVVEPTFARESTALLKRGSLPDQRSLTTLELVRTLLKAHKLTQSYLPYFMTRHDLIAQSVYRVGAGKIGDLVLFKPY
jgi:hypothetical protein